jgi:hypothetical protein
MGLSVHLLGSMLTGLHFLSCFVQTMQSFEFSEKKTVAAVGAPFLRLPGRSEPLFRHLLSFLDAGSSGKTVGGAYPLFIVARLCRSARDWAATRVASLETLDLSFTAVQQMLSKAELDGCLRFVLSRVPKRLSTISLKRQFYTEESTIRLVLLADTWFPQPLYFNMRATILGPSITFVTALMLQGPAVLEVFCGISVHSSDCSVVIRLADVAACIAP